MIGIVISNKLGGIAQWNIANVLNSNHYLVNETKIILITCKDDGSDQISEDELIGLSLIKFQYSKFDNLYYVFEKLNKILKEFELIISNDQFELKALSLLSTRPKIIANIADWYNLTYVSTYYSIIDYYITLSKQIEDIINSSSREKIAFYLAHGVKKQKVNKLIFNSRSINFIFIGRLVESKGCLELIRIENMLNTINIKTNWRIIGSGPKEKEMKEQWSYKENILFTQPKSRSELEKELRESDILVLPSEFEGYGIAILEAMSFGVIPAVYKLPIGITNELNEANSIMSTEISIENLVDRIAEVIKDPDRILYLKSNARDFVDSKFDINKTSNRYFDFYSEVITKKFHNINVHKNHIRESLLDKKYFPPILSRILRKTKYYATH